MVPPLFFTILSERLGLLFRNGACLMWYTYLAPEGPAIVQFLGVLDELHHVDYRESVGA